MQDLTGQDIQDYQIEEEIGRGGMARVYRARHRVLDRTSALKILLPELSGDEKFIERFLREARSAARLEHPNIVPIYETGRTSTGYFYLAMKYIEGGTLRRVMSQGPLPPAQVAAYAAQIAAALDYAHERGIVHRDIKPGNILVDATGRLALTDFGIAQAAEDISVTAQGMLVGTPAYMSPEQAQGLPATAQSDIYSLGVVVYELLTGTTPFPHRTPHAVLLGQISEPPLPVHDRNHDLTPEISAVVGKALAKSPEDRYATAGEFARALAVAAGVEPGAELTNGVTIPDLEDGEVADEPTLIEQPAHRRLLPSTWISERGRWFLAGAMVMAIVFLAVAWIFTDPLGNSSAASGRLSIDTLPPGAEISLNGQSLGAAPQTIEDLARGEHVIRAEIPSYAPAEETVDIEGGEEQVSLVLQPLPAHEVLEITRATMTHGVEERAGGIQAPVDTAVEFAPDEEAVAFAFATSSAYQVRDLEFVFQSRWYGPDGTLRSTSRPVMVNLPASGEVWYLTASDRAGDVDPLASGEPSKVELLIDDVVIQTLEFRVIEPS